jgi:hypothetical protein
VAEHLFGYHVVTEEVFDCFGVVAGGHQRCRVDCGERHQAVGSVGRERGAARMSWPSRMCRNQVHELR